MKNRLVRVLRRRRNAGIAVAVVLACVLAGIELILTEGSSREPVRIRNVSQNYRVCLLAAPRGEKQSDHLWQAIRDAKKGRHLNAERFATLDDTAESLPVYLNTLIAQQCQMIIAASGDLRDAVTHAAREHPRLRFVEPDAPDAPDAPGNVTALPGNPDDLTRLVAAAAADHPPKVPPPTR